MSKQNVQRFISRSANLEGSVALFVLVTCAEGFIFTVGVLLTPAFIGLGICAYIRGSRGFSLQLHFIAGALTSAFCTSCASVGLRNCLCLLNLCVMVPPFQVVRASVESLTRGPVIQANDKEILQQYADMIQVTYDILKVMGYLSEMNADNLEKAIM